MVRLTCLACLVSLLLAGCLPAAMPPPTSLPTVHVFTTSQPTRALPVSVSTIPPTPVPTVIPQGNAQIARAVYGTRLVEWIEIPAINVFAPVTPVGWSAGGSNPDPAAAGWDSPGAQVGWVMTSALPGDSQGNIILYGHNNIDSMVFRSLYTLAMGDEIILTTGEDVYRYRVAESHILPVLEDGEDALAYAEYLKSSRVPRLTLISCYPPDNNTHRVVVVGYGE